MGSVSGWDGRVCSWLWVFGVFHTPLLSGPTWFHRSLSTSTTAVRHLLYRCTTWWVGGSLRERHCFTTPSCTAVSGWVHRFVAVVCSCRVSTASWRIFFFLSLFFSPLNRPRAGMVQRTTSIFFVFFCVKRSINNHIVRSVHKKHIIRTCLMYHAACKVAFQSFKRSYSQLTFFNLKKKGKRLNRVYPGRTTTYQGTLFIQTLHARS